MSGTGPGVITPDGCAVDCYALLPPGPDPSIVDGAVPVGGSILELGCGTGRILRPLAALGHPVVGVDESPEMLAHLGDLPAVCARIEDLWLDRRFDAVLLASHLVNTPDEAQRRAWLATCRRHVRPGGVVVVQQHSAAWLGQGPAPSDATRDGVRFVLRDVVRDGPLVSAVVEYHADDRVWTQSFTTRPLTTGELDATLTHAGLTRQRWLTDDHTWLAAAPA